LVLETLAGHKAIPVLAEVGDGKTYHARWLPVLDGPKDAAKLAQLEAGMPSVCRAEIFVSNGERRKEELPPTPKALLTSFLHTFCDALARSWGKAAAPGFPRGEDTPAARWLDALFRQNPDVKASPAQLQHLASSHKAWMRNLHVAGDAAFRIAFRLEAPALQSQPWNLHYLVQAKDDLSLLIPAEEVWKKSGGALMHLGRRFDHPHEKLLAGLGYAARLFPPVKSSLKDKRPAGLSLDAPRPTPS